MEHFVLIQHHLDRNIVSDFIRAPNGRAASRIQVVGEALVRTSIMVAKQSRFGALGRGSARPMARLEAGDSGSAGDGVALGHKDDGQRFGLPEPIEGEVQANELLAGKCVKGVEPDRITADI